MSDSPHLRSDSSDTSSSGASYQLILDHVLSRPATYEIPLRTMYTLNCAPRARPMPPHGQTATSSNASSPVSSQGGWHNKEATQTFTENLMTELSQLPTQPQSLPPSFITSFLQRCFPPELVYVDFPQALTGLDYLKDLETRRRSQVSNAMARLGIDRKTLGSNRETLSPEVAERVSSIEKKESKIEQFYTQLYVSLRRWIMINEMSLLPFNEQNCMAMLNTLFPPVVSVAPTSRLTPKILKDFHEGFFNYIRSVKKSGPRVLKKLMDQGKLENDENGWIAVTRTLGWYLQVANSMITDCAAIGEGDAISPASNPKTSRSSRKADSGISFGSSEQPASRQGSVAEPTSFMDLQLRPKTPVGGRSGTALEKLARGLKHIGRSRTEATETVSMSPPKRTPSQNEVKPKADSKNESIRKVRSFATIEGRNRNRTSPSSPQESNEAPFDVEEMRRQRMRFEAGIVSAQRNGSTYSHDV